MEGLSVQEMANMLLETGEYTQEEIRRMTRSELEDAIMDMSDDDLFDCNFDDDFDDLDDDLDVQDLFNDDELNNIIKNGKA